MTNPNATKGSAAEREVAAAPVTIVAYGTPAPQGSKRHVGRGVMVESSKAVKPWREAVKTAALEVMDGRPALDGPLRVSMVFTVRKPTSAPKSRRTWPDRTPDLSKLCRATEDALTEAGVWTDDARVVAYDWLAKVFPGEDVGALHIPGVTVTVWRVADYLSTVAGADDCLADRCAMAGPDA